MKDFVELLLVVATIEESSVLLPIWRSVGRLIILLNLWLLFDEFRLRCRGSILHLDIVKLIVVVKVLATLQLEIS